MAAVDFLCANGCTTVEREKMFLLLCVYCMHFLLPFDLMGFPGHFLDITAIPFLFELLELISKNSIFRYVG